MIPLDQVDRPLPAPLLDLLPAPDRLFHRTAVPEPHQPVHAVVFCEAFNQAGTMLMPPLKAI